MPPVFVVPFAAPEPDSVPSPEPDVVLPACAPAEFEPPFDCEPPLAGEEDVDEEPLEDESFAESSLPQAVSKRAPVTPRAARAVLRVYFMVFPLR
ncbi:hypothetical protein ACFH04_08560 [Streptomyces noboritoensis]|uniref:Uncharacterized protein n=1 Tax=Streptomyces noboritoensis TaxID=67337 RepID=A0ABV6TEX0_9ACTN